MRAIPVIIAAIALLPGSADAAMGTDSFGYRWADSSEPECPAGAVTADTPNEVVVNGEDVVGPFAIGFPFPLYGQLFSEVWISANGFLTLGAAAPPASPAPAAPANPAPPNAVVAPLWGDLGAGRIAYGVVAADGYFFVRWRAPFAGDVSARVPEARLYSDGRIVFLYGASFESLTVPQRSLFVSGIEDAAGSRGIATWDRGVGLDGYSFSGPHSLCFWPPPVLACSGTIGCDQTRSLDTSTRPSSVSGYSCSNAILGGGEASYTLTLSNLTEVSAVLSGIGARDVRLYLLDGCDESGCIEGDATTLGPQLLPAGTYTLVADSGVADVGPVDVTTTCIQRGLSSTCGAIEVGSVGAGYSQFDTYACEPDAAYPGAEVYYELTVATTTNLRVDVTAACDVDVFVFPAGDIDPSRCVAGGRGGATLFAATPGDYVVIVEGRNGAACGFEAALTCAINADCGAPAAVLACGDTIAGSTVAASNSIDDYSCRPGVSYDGGEVLYQIDATAFQSVGVVLEGATDPGLEVMLLGACDEGDCRDAHGAAMTCDGSVAPAATTRYAVVDGRDGAVGDYTLRVACGPPADSRDWRTCEVPFAPTTTETRASDLWRFHTPLPDVTEPDPEPAGSFCGTGCDFALYLPISCGGNLTLAVTDLESVSSIELTNLFSGRKALFDADNNGGATGTDPWTYSGYAPGWLSQPCLAPAPSDPPDLGRDNPRFNDTVMELALAAGESACGLWRLDVFSAGGVNWDLHASCSADLLPGYILYDNPCAAADAWDPRPQFEVANLATDGGCPVATISFDISNLGCVSRTAPWRLDGGPGAVVDGSTFLVAGATRAVVQTVDVTAISGRVELTVDVNDVVAECSEAGNLPCPGDGARSLALQACAGCATPMPPTGVIGNAVRAVAAAAGVDLSWSTAPPLATAIASHFHVYRSDRVRGGTWTNLPVPDTLVLTALLDPAPADALNLYQVRFNNDCEEQSGGPLP